MFDPLYNPDPNSELPTVEGKYLPFWQEKSRAKCVKDNPPMRGFGRQLKVGDEVVVDGVIWNGQYELSVPAECAFYVMERFFETMP